MKLEKHFKIVAYVISALILITAILSVCFVMCPFIMGISAPKIILDILTVMYLLIPTAGITSMLTFIFLKKKNG